VWVQELQHPIEGLSDAMENLLNILSHFLNKKDVKNQDPRKKLSYKTQSSANGHVSSRLQGTWSF
jgi:hypothetical protein